MIWSPRHRHTTTLKGHWHRWNENQRKMIKLKHILHYQCLHWCSHRKFIYKSWYFIKKYVVFFTRDNKICMIYILNNCNKWWNDHCSRNHHNIIIVVFVNKLIIVMICFPRGSLLSRNLGELVKKEHFVLDSEYLTTLLVVVPKWV